MHMCDDMQIVWLYTCVRVCTSALHPRFILNLVFLTFCTATDSICRWMLFVFRGAQLLQQQSHSILYASSGAISPIWTKSSCYGCPSLVKWTLFIASCHCTCRAYSSSSTPSWWLLGWQPQSRAPATVEAPSWLCVTCLLSPFFRSMSVLHQCTWLAA